MQTPLNIQLINQVCWEHFLDLRDGENQIYTLDPSQTHLETRHLSWLEGDQPISLIQAGHCLSQWVQESMEKYGKVILYTCRDNSNIAIEDPESFDNNELDLFKKYSGPLGDLPLYIGYD